VTYVFGKQSSGIRSLRPASSAGSPYSEVTDTCLPSSFRSFHPFTLVHLYQPTCVGLRYGLVLLTLRVFLGTFSFLVVRSVDLTSALLQRKSNNPLRATRYVTLQKSTGGRNINRLSIIRLFSETRLRPA
jgi:hypothetical protein